MYSKGHQHFFFYNLLRELVKNRSVVGEFMRQPINGKPAEF